MNEPKYVFLDLETTGLDPTFDVILEVGMVITDRDLNELASFSRTIKWDAIEYNQLTGEYTPPFGVGSVVTDMHENSGLWHDSYRSTFTQLDALSDASFWLGQQLYNAGGKLPLAGNNVSFDRTFLQLQDPKFIDQFDYHNFDMSSIKIAYVDWVEGDAYTENNPVEALPVGNKLHRSVPDCLDSIQEARFFRRKMKSM